MNKKFLLVNLRTGVMDGIYRSKSGAQSSMDYFESIGQRGWVLTSIEQTSESRQSIPNNLFHRTAGAIANEKLIIKHFQKVMTTQKAIGEAQQ